jgi:hypothetical protein
MTDTITCSYTFTAEEFRTTALLSRRLLPLWRKIFSTGVALVFLVLGPVSALGLLRQNGAFDYGGLIPAIILVLVGLFLLKRIIPLRAFCSVRAFRKRRICNRLVQNTVSQEGIGSQTEDSAATLLGSGIGKAVESADGFAIFMTESRGTFIWYPLHGFASQADIDRCRSLFQEHVKTFRRV